MAVCFRVNSHHPKELNISTESQELSEEILDSYCSQPFFQKTSEVVAIFLKTQQNLYEKAKNIHSTLLSEKPKFHPIEKLNIEGRFSMDTSKKILCIWMHIREQFPHNIPIRIKIEKIASVTLIKGKDFEDDTLFVSLKKKTNLCLFSIGRKSAHAEKEIKVTQGLRIKNNTVIFTAEKTEYAKDKSRFPKPREDLQQVLNNPFFLNSLVSNDYTGNISLSSGAKQEITKHTQIYECWSSDLFDVCNMNVCLYKRLTKKTLETIFKFFIDVLQHLHENDVICRDFKPENIFVKLNLLNPTEITDIVMGDTEMIIYKKDLDSQTFRAGTPAYCPPNVKKKREKEGKPSDMYALGVTLQTLQKCGFLKGLHYEDMMEKLINDLTAKDAKDRPTIEQVAYLLERFIF